ncbi:MAG: HNH endonuclease signature motif containing protein [Bdellovibrionia bacterium]
MNDQKKIQRLRALSVDDLFSAARNAVKEESNATLTVLYLLREIERRRAFAARSYPSLFEFCVDYLGYKRGAAYRRITAMRALKDLPEIEDKIRDGSLSLMSVSQAQSHFQAVKRENGPLDKSQKLEILSSIQNKSTRETDEFFLKLAPAENPREKLRPIDVELFELRLPWPKRLQEKLVRLKAALGAEKSGIETGEALERAMDLAIQHFEKRAENSIARGIRKKAHASVEPNLVQESASASDSAKVPAPGKSRQEMSQREMSQREESQREMPRWKVPRNGSNRYISIAVRNSIWGRDGGRCSFLDSKSGRRCNSRFKLEVDHIVPIAHGGNSDSTNLRLLCRAHNQFEGISKLGSRVMGKFLDN